MTLQEFSGLRLFRVDRAPSAISNSAHAPDRHFSPNTVVFVRSDCSHEKSQLSKKQLDASAVDRDQAAANI